MPNPNYTIIGNGKYRLEKVIASGSFGKVYDCYPYAIKELKIPNSREAHPDLLFHIKSTLANEINILKDVNHDNVVKLYEVIYQKDYTYLVMEHCQSDLKGKCAGKAQGEKRAIQIMLQILEGCKEMVNLNIVHRDFKPANILFNKGLYKLADFGMAKYLQNPEDDMLRSRVGTPFYMAPQILQRKPYSKKCDIWSLGIIFYQLICGKLPWQGRDEKALLTNILSQKLRIPTTVSSQTKDILLRMLSISEQKRLNWSELFMMFELLKYKHEEIKVVKEKEKITYHRSAIQQMIDIEKKRVAKNQFKMKFQALNSDQILHVKKIIESYYGEEYLYVVKEFFPQYRKLQEQMSLMRKPNQNQ